MTANKGNKSDSKKTSEDESMPSQRFEDDNLLETSVLPEATPENIQALHDQIETINQALKESQEKADGNWQRLLRKEAEFQNLQRRMEQDVDNTRKFAIERFAAEILHVMDSLEQGIGFAENSQTTAKDLLEGMTLTRSMLLNALDKQGIKPIDPAIGEAFNPTYHEAISVQETKDMPANQIITVVQKGYMLHNRLLRPARVVVSRAPGAA